MRLFVVADERGFSAVLLHQLLILLQADNFYERYVNCLSAGLDAEDADGFVGELRVQPDGSSFKGHYYTPVNRI